MWNCAIQIINLFEMCNQTISVIRWTKCCRGEGGRGLVGFVKSYRSMRMRKRFDRDRNTERKIRLNDESAAKFNVAYRKLPPSPSPSLSRARAHEYSLVRSSANFADTSFANARSPRKLSGELNSLESFTIKCFPLISLITDVLDKLSRIQPADVTRNVLKYSILHDRAFDR